VAKLAIAVEEKKPVRRRNTARYCQDFDNDEFGELDDDKQVKPKRIGTKVRFDTCIQGVYYQNCYNKRHFTKECKLLIKKIQICKSDNHNIDQCPSKLASGRCPTREIVLVHVVQVETPII
jgi:hypothetical protein